MTLTSDPTYPMNRCYVLKLSRDGCVKGELPAGRLENMRSGQQFVFRDAAEFLACLAIDLNSNQEEER